MGKIGPVRQRSGRYLPVPGTVYPEYKQRENAPSLPVLLLLYCVGLLVVVVIVVDDVNDYEVNDGKGRCHGGTSARTTTHFHSRWRASARLPVHSRARGVERARALSG